MSRFFKILAFGFGLTSVESAMAKEAKFLGVSSCASSPCHGSITPLKGGQIQRNEFTIWSRHDQHAKAYQTLLNARSQQIAKNLGIAKAEASDECLSCHSTSAKINLRSVDFRFSDGVSCEGCHGAAEFYLKAHVSGKKTPSELGMADLSNPYSLAMVCLNCHIGRENTWLTHRLYGAGHPRLSFQLETYAANQPPHYNDDSDYKKRKGELSPATRWLAGEVERGIRQIQQLESFKFEGWPDLASHYCYGCHHALTRNEWSFKQQSDSPGIPKLNLSSVYMASLGLSVLDPDEAKKVEGLLASKKLNEVREILESTRTQMSQVRISKIESQRILNQILKFAASRVEAENYEVAEQIAMATSSLLAELPAPNQNYPQELRSIFLSLESPESFKPGEFRRACSQLQNRLRDHAN